MIPTGAFRINRASEQSRGLLAWWPALFSRGCNVWYDLVNGINLNNSGGVGDVSADKLGWAKDWASDEIYAAAVGAPLLTAVGTQLTIAAWVRIAAGSTGNRHIFSVTTNSSAAIAYQILRSNTGLWFYVGATSQATGLIFSDTAWKHIVCVYDGAYLRSYVNGVEVGTPAAYSSAVSTGSENIPAIGARTSAANYWRGDIAEVRVYGRALSAAEVWKLYAEETRWELYDTGLALTVKAPTTVNPDGMKIYVDWDDDLDWNDDYENVTEYVKSADWQIGMDAPFQLVGGDTELTLLLNNFGKEFSPENAESPFYGEMLPQRRVKIIYRLDGTDYPLYLGYLRDVVPAGGDGRVATLSAVGPQPFFEKQNVNLSLMEDARSDEVIEAILSKLQLPAAGGTDIWMLGIAGHSELGVTTVLGDFSALFDLEAGLTSFDYAADNWTDEVHDAQYVGESWKSGLNGLDVITDVVRAERGLFFFDREGKAIFWNRAHLPTTDTLSETFDMQFAQEPIYAYGADMANRVRVKVYPRNLSASDTLLWQLDEDIVLRPGDEHTINVSYTDEDSADDIAAKDSYIDGPSVVHDGSDVDFLTEFDARGAKITITNNDPADVTITGLAIKGKALTTFNEIECVAEDPANRAQYGYNDYVIDSKLMGSSLFAQTIADYELSRRKDPYGAIRSMNIRADTAERLEQVVNRTIGDRIRVIDDQLSHDAEYFIIGERHTWGLREFWNVEWILEPAQTLQVWLLGVAGHSELGETTVLAL